ncbi:MAG: uncharacterized protein KVP18_002720 [Porospora cf. gigantea A]|uniref:uncharacterized protein n=1 Tax=Porospora cf. gigantea A TaxID=2853593 RepID=UPI0035594DE8|nr:MAG: hypothetical protein KVP18_002720 [Porospora cf. gigantea A]
MDNPEEIPLDLVTDVLPPPPPPNDVNPEEVSLCLSVGTPEEPVRSAPSIVASFSEQGVCLKNRRTQKVLRIDGSSVVDDLRLAEAYATMQNEVQWQQERVPMQPIPQVQSDSESESCPDEDVRAIVARDRHQPEASYLDRLMAANSLEPAACHDEPPLEEAHAVDWKSVVSYIAPSHPLDKLGCVYQLLSSQSVVLACFNPQQTYAPGTPVCLWNRSVIGVVADCFGPVHTPFYSVALHPEKTAYVADLAANSPKGLDPAGGPPQLRPDMWLYVDIFAAERMEIEAS